MVECLRPEILFCFTCPGPPPSPGRAPTPGRPRARERRAALLAAAERVLAPVRGGRERVEQEGVVRGCREALMGIRYTQ